MELGLIELLEKYCPSMHFTSVDIHLNGMVGKQMMQANWK